MLWLNVFTSCQISDSAGQFQDTMIGTRRELQLAHCLAHQGTPGIIKLAVLAHFCHAHVGIAVQFVVQTAVWFSAIGSEVLALDLARGFDTSLDCL
jgi:hypothetical protein